MSLHLRLALTATALLASFAIGPFSPLFAKEPALAGAPDEQEMTPPIIDEQGEIAPRRVGPGSDQATPPDASPEITGPSGQEPLPPIIKRGEVPPQPLPPNGEGAESPDLLPGQDEEGRQPGGAMQQGQSGQGAMPGEPESPEQRQKLLANLYDQLASAKNAEVATEIEQNIEQAWNASGSDTIDLLISRAQNFVKQQDLDLATRILDAVVELDPDDAEALRQRALVHAMRKDYADALSDLRRAIALDPRHYQALDGLGGVLEALGDKKGALEAYRQALKVNPFLDDARNHADDLKHAIEGQDI